MKKTDLDTWLYSSLGVVAVFVIIVAVNVLGAQATKRIDLTQEHAYTLSAGTRAILAKLDTPVQIRLYCSRSVNTMPVALKVYAQRVEDLLGEYQQASKGLIEIQKLDPVPDSDAADSARLDGVEGQRRPDGEPIYLGLSVRMLDQEEALPFLAPQRERLLEYDISRAITRVAAADKPVVGLMSSLPVAGVPPDPRNPKKAPQPVWTLYNELANDFTVKTVELTAGSIPEDIKVLLLIHPRGISDSTQYAIDQFVLRGGKLIAFLDPQCILDPSAGPRNPGGPSSSNLEKLLKAWGLSFDSAHVVADLDYLTRLGQARQAAALTLNETAMNKDDVVTANVDNLRIVYAGAFSGTPVEGLTETVLLKSSRNSQLVDPTKSYYGAEKIIQEFSRSGVEYPLAVRLTGKFKTAFPEGQPPESEPATAAPPGEKKTGGPGEAGLKVSAADTAVILVGDADFIQDRIAIQETVSPFNGQRMAMPANGNLAFAQGAIEQFAGDDDLIAVRSRAARERPFTVVTELQAKAESASESKIKELEASLTETRAKLGELRRTKDDTGAQKFILSPEQQAQIDEFRAKETQVKGELKEERKKLRAEIDSLENHIKWLNIGLMPAIVAVGGVALAAVRHQRRAAR
jgi:ABC-type uncharacterized transport system involved in gliding motility auxiliary subunit